jgi:hypothetical protein
MIGSVNTYSTTETRFINPEYHYVFLDDYGSKTSNLKTWLIGDVAKGSAILSHFATLPSHEATSYATATAIEKETKRMGIMVKRLRKHKDDTTQIYFDEHAASSGAMGLALKAILLLPYEFLPQLLGDKNAEQEPWATIIKLRLEQIL